MYWLAFFNVALGVMVPVFLALMVIRLLSEDE